MFSSVLRPLSYLLNVGDVQRGVDEPSVHRVSSVFAFLVQVHGLQARKKKNLYHIYGRKGVGRGGGLETTQTFVVGDFTGLDFK